jgi:hypothetical protein
LELVAAGRAFSGRVHRAFRRKKLRKAGTPNFAPI